MRAITLRSPLGIYFKITFRSRVRARARLVVSLSALHVNVVDMSVNAIRDKFPESKFKLYINPARVSAEGNN